MRIFADQPESASQCSNDRVSGDGCYVFRHDPVRYFCGSRRSSITEFFAEGRLSSRSYARLESRRSISRSARAVFL
jgi:hypothetical protein